LPADLGFYDLRLAEVREAQADLARNYGIHGFCYYHYWFNGKRLLHRPIDEVLASQKPDFPFCLCWANENWTRAWDGQANQLLIGQNYSPEDDRMHIRWLLKLFQDERYVCVDGRPLFLVYRIGHLPHPRQTAAIWREEAYKAGLGDLFLCKVESFEDGRTQPADMGFDAAVEFQPDTAALLTPLEKIYWRLVKALHFRKGALVIPYADWVKRSLQRSSPSYLRFPCVTPSWDNSARRPSGAFILHKSTPEHYERWLKGAIAKFSPPMPGQNLLFINAWNEWAEGNHLEPCQRWGTAYLEATQRAVSPFQVTV
jgi:lipopolysaccharide biosynthesis protein